VSVGLSEAGGAIFVLLGVGHAAYTLLDARQPRRLAPADARVTEAMRATGVRLARGSRVTMWQAWIGFNLSHSLGAIVFGLLAAQSTGAAWPVAIAALYLAIGLRCWFWAPNTALALAALCFAIAPLNGP
jgi:hypothetical protein